MCNAMRMQAKFQHFNKKNENKSLMHEYIHDIHKKGVKKKKVFFSLIEDIIILHTYMT